MLTVAYSMAALPGQRAILGGPFLSLITVIFLSFGDFFLLSLRQFYLSIWFSLLFFSSSSLRRT